MINTIIVNTIIVKLIKLSCCHNISHNDSRFRSIGGIVPISVLLLPRALYLFFRDKYGAVLHKQDAILPYHVGRATGSPYSGNE